MEDTEKHGGILRTCEVRFEEEKQLINQIIDKLKGNNSQEASYYDSLLKNINAIEKNIEALNDVAKLIWVGNFFATIHKVIPGDPNEPFEFLPQKVEPHPITQERVKFLKILTYFQNHTFQDASDDFFIALENLYSSAYRAKSAVPQFYNFKPKGVSYVRNNLLEHPSDKFRWVLKQHTMSVNKAPVIEYCAIPLDTGKPKQDKLIVNIESDFTQYKSDLNKKLKSILESLN